MIAFVRARFAVGALQAGRLPLMQAKMLALPGNRVFAVRPDYEL